MLLSVTPSPRPVPVPASDTETSAETLSRWLTWPVKLLAIVVIAVMVRWVVCRIIDRTVVHLVDNALARRLAATSPSTPISDEQDLAARLHQRARTVAGILKSITTLVVFGIAAVVALAALGIDVGPLILSAGVVGIAIGFGAQSLVKDFLTGAFMILEDQYAVGDVIDTGEAIGTVEEVGLRLTRISDFEGVVWYVPHGSIQRIGNRSQGFGLAIVDIPLAYGADVDRASAAIRAAVTALAHDPEWSDDLFDEPPLVAVESMTSTAINMQVRQRTRPLRNLPVGRALRERIIETLDEEGIARPAVGGAAGSRLDPDVADPAGGPS